MCHSSRRLCVRLCPGIAIHSKSAVVFGFACWPFHQLAQYTSDLHYRIPPLVVEDTPSGMSTSEYVVKLEADGGAVVNASRPLSEELAAFLGSDARTLLVLGEPGCGKTLFVWATVAQLVAVSRGQSGCAEASAAAFVPVVIDLKHYKASELSGLLPRYLQSRSGLRDGDVDGLRFGQQGGVARGSGAPRVLLLCDGLDELQAEEGGEAETARARASLQDLFVVLCGGSVHAWGAWSLKVVVTSRESRFRGRMEEQRVLGAHRRALLLPFNKCQVGGCLCGCLRWRMLRCRNVLVRPFASCVCVSAVVWCGCFADSIVPRRGFRRSRNSSCRCLYHGRRSSWRNSRCWPSVWLRASSV